MTPLRSSGETQCNPDWIVRTHQDDTRWSEAIYSACETYRYALTRHWAEGPKLNVVMLNPSTADERRNDPTIERCERRARAGGFGAFRITNLFAVRATDPREMKRHPAPIGSDNDAVLREACRWADLTLCGWGVHGVHQGRNAHVAALLRAESDLHVLGLSRDGHPRHPLYVAYAQGPRPWAI